jgi:hypothetical protein
MNPERHYPKQWREYIKRKQNGTDEMTLKQFLALWQVSRQDLAILCECSIDTVNHGSIPILQGGKRMGSIFAIIARE